MIPQHRAEERSSNIAYPIESQGNITGDIFRMLRALLDQLKSGMHRLAYGEQTDLGQENQYLYDPELQRWVRRDAAESQTQNLTIGDALGSSQAEVPGSEHPHCISPHINPLIAPTPFRGVFKRPEQGSVTSDRYSAVDMTALSHPVYAPTGSVLETDTLAVVERPKSPDPIIPTVRTSPFSK